MFFLIGDDQEATGRRGGLARVRDQKGEQKERSDN
jgi:hypothetical protein